MPIQPVRSLVTWTRLTLLVAASLAALGSGSSQKSPPPPNYGPPGGGGAPGGGGQPDYSVKPQSGGGWHCFRAIDTPDLSACSKTQNDCWQLLSAVQQDVPTARFSQCTYQQWSSCHTRWLNEQGRSQWFCSMNDSDCAADRQYAMSKPKYSNISMCQAWD
jgi:hypothetical protein